MGVMVWDYGGEKLNLDGKLASSFEFTSLAFLATVDTGLFIYIKIAIIGPLLLSN